MSESSLWRTLRAAAKKHGGGHWVRVENAVGNGTPDVNYCLEGAEGWIELKCEDEWPKRDETPFRVKKLRADQVRWLSERHRRGGRAWVLLKITRPREYFLFEASPAVLDMLKTGAVRQTVRQAAILWQPGDFPAERLFGVLKR